ncbi:hypothetical protein ACFL6X_09740, partial [Candidatus Latescibacterota bacterium]
MPLSAAHQQGNLTMAHADLSAADAAGAGLVRYFDSFDTAPGIFGRGWRAVPYLLQLPHELSGAPGDRGEVVPGTEVTLVDRANRRNESHVIVGGFGRGAGLRLTLDNEYV